MADKQRWHPNETPGEGLLNNDEFAAQVAALITNPEPDALAVHLGNLRELRDVMVARALFVAELWNEASDRIHRKEPYTAGELGFRLARWMSQALEDAGRNLAALGYTPDLGRLDEGEE